jgi:hypothetical protein
VSTNTDKYDIEKNNRLHLHCWFTYKPFSKYQFKAGKYNHLNPNTYLNDTSAVGYVSRILINRSYIYFLLNIIDLEGLNWNYFYLLFILVYANGFRISFNVIY